MKIKSYSLLLIILAGFSGVTNGYMLAVIAFITPIISKQYAFNTAQISYLTGAILLGCFIASLFTGLLNDKFGSKKIMILALIVYILGIVLFVISKHSYTFYLGRLIQGIAYGISVIAFPIYFAETSPTKIRGIVLVFFHISITFGVLLSNLLGMLFNFTDWSILFFIVIVFFVIIFIITLFTPESPRFLMKNNRKQEGLQILQLFYNKNDAIAIYNEIIKQASNQHKNLKELLKSCFFSKKNRLAIIVITCAVCLLQLTGINVFLQSSIYIIKVSGLSSTIIQMLGSIFIAGIYFIATMFTLLLIEKVGRKIILAIGSIGMILTCLSLAVLNMILPVGLILGYITLFGITLLIAFFAFGPSGVVVSSCAELLPNKIRGIGISIAFSVGALVGVGFVSNVFLIAEVIGYSGLYLFIGVFASMYLIILFIIPETKGKNLEEIEDIW